MKFDFDVVRSVAFVNEDFSAQQLHNFIVSVIFYNSECITL